MSRLTPEEQDRRRELMRQRRDERMRQYRDEFEDCLESAKNLLPHRANEKHFERVIHALYWPVRGEVPEDWWDAESLEVFYQCFLYDNEWWLSSIYAPIELSDSAVDRLAATLVGTSQKLKAMRSESEPQ